MGVVLNCLERGGGRIIKCNVRIGGGGGEVVAEVGGREKEAGRKVMVFGNSWTVWWMNSEDDAPLHPFSLDIYNVF